MAEFARRVSSDVRLSWSYEGDDPRIRELYERAKRSQWNAATDVDWSCEVEFGGPLPEASPYALASFDASPLGGRGRQLWHDFRWEFQSWLASQFLHGEQAALVTTARLAEALPGLDAKLFAASQVGDEARHVEAFARYVGQVIPRPYAISPPLAALVGDVLADSRWDVAALGMQIIIEGLALASFRLADASFHDRLAKQIIRLVARDEGRHVSFGILALRGLCRELSQAERAEREDFVLEAAMLMRRRFLLEDVWERLEVDAEAGRTFAETSEVMVAYRRTIFAKVVSALVQIGLMSPRVRDGLAAMDLLGYAGRGAVAAVRRATEERPWGRADG